MGRHSSESADSDSGENSTGPRRRVDPPPVTGPTPAAKPGDSFGFDHREVKSSHRGAWLWGLGALVVIAALVAGVIIWRTVGSSECDDRQRVTVAADPTIAASLREAAATVSAQGCYDYTVNAVSGADAPGVLTSGDQRPDLWVPDSQTQARRVSTQVRQDLNLTSESLVSTPTVVVGKKLPELTGWQQVMTLPDLRTGSPIVTSTGDAPIVGALAEVDAGKLTQPELVNAMTTLAVQQNNFRTVNDSEGMRLNLANTSDVPVVTTEQQYILFMRTHQGSDLKFAIPSDGTVLLDYPLVNIAPTARGAAADAAGKELASAIAGSAGEPLAQAGFREPGGRAAPGEHPYGTGQPVTVLTLRDPAAVDKALRQWQVLGVPIRTLVVQDVSGSMEESAGSGSSTRAELLTEASLTGLTLFPNNAMIGGWAFSVDRGPDGQDWEQLAAIKRLDAPADNGRTHRDVLAAAVKAGLAPDNLGGGTGLYDTTLAAFKQVQDTYDPNYSNSVIIMTDGQNDDRDSISLDDLLSQLKELEDPARPVLILTIAISDDADTDALKQIADATGGTTYVATTADDIRSVFVNAIAARVEAAGR
ncbi:VWA domain-containing protein [Gordonia sp. NPDC003950]